MHEEIDLERRMKELDEEDLKVSSEKGDERSTSFDRQKLGRRLLIAAEKGRLLELANLLRIDGSLVKFADSDGYTAIHRASYGSHKDCIKYLLKHGADIDAKTNDLWTPLHCAARWNSVDVADYLLQCGADVNAKSSGGNTPLHIAASNGRYSLTCDLIQLLLFHPNCDYLIRNDSGDTAFDIAKRSGPFYKFWNGVTTIYPHGLELEPS